MSVYDIPKTQPSPNEPIHNPLIEDGNNPPKQVGNLAEDKSIEQMDSSSSLDKENNAEIAHYQERATSALSLVNDVVLKSYLVQLSNMDLIEQPDVTSDGIILFKIKKMVYDKDESVMDKFIGTISAMTFASCSIFLIVDGYSDRTDFYLGIKSNDDNRTASSIADAFKNSISGQFPGIQLDNLSFVEQGASASKQSILFDRLKYAKCISSCVGIPAEKVTNKDHANTGFVQGIEKLALAMRGKEFTAIILAQNTSPAEVQSIRIGYENLYTQLSTQATQQLSYSANESLANALSRTKGYSDSESLGKSHTTSNSKAKTQGVTESGSETTGTSKNNFWGKAGKAAAPLMEAGAILTATGVGAPAGAILMAVGGIAGLGNIIGASTDNKSKTTTKGTNTSNTETQSDSDTETQSSTHQENFSETNGRTASIGTSKNFTLTVHNKHIEEILKRIDKQLQRIEQAESSGLWQAGAYFLSYSVDNSSAEIAATIYRSIMQGDDSGIETSAINTWLINENDKSIPVLPATIASFTHPVFSYKTGLTESPIPVTGTSLISSAELAMMISLPRKSVPGLPVVEYASLAKEVVSYSSDSKSHNVHLGCIFDYGIEHPENKVVLKQKSLTQHIFVTGSTGCGKSETVYKLITEARQRGVSFLVVEPAKGEYKTVFGDVRVYGTNPKRSKLLRINPFRFPCGHNGIHVLEHIDRLVEIFNVCWPMYAAMPAVLKKAVLASYEKCGWDLVNSINKNSDELFPTFSDLLDELVNAINESAYSDEVKSNYTGSLVTRIESLTNGLNGEIFASNDLSDALLFDENAIIDLSRVGSSETKSLIMGIIIMKLSEYRMSGSTSPNSSLQHLTILEEAHNILKRTSTEQSMEGSNVAGKAVEMITNAIAEMRTYGEGFVIVDQSPTSVSPAAIKNTNTKIIMRLPDGDDRWIAGKAASMKDNQIDEIAKLPTGVAVVYQNDWIAPVLCKVKQYDGPRVSYTFASEVIPFDNTKALLAEVLKMLLYGRISTPCQYDSAFIRNGIKKCKLPTQLKLEIIQITNDCDAGISRIWDNDCFPHLSKIVSDILSTQTIVASIVNKAKDFKDLNSLLDRFIIQQASIPENEKLLLAICQCLMFQYGKKNTTCQKIYDAWFNDIKKQIVS